MGSELARADEATRGVATQGFRELVDIVAQQSASSAEVARSDAIFQMSAMIGAVTMARIVDDPTLSDQILDDVKRRLTAVAPAVRKKQGAPA